MNNTTGAETESQLPQTESSAAEENDAPATSGSRELFELFIQMQQMQSAIVRINEQHDGK